MSMHVAPTSINWDAQVSLRLLVDSMPIAVVIVDSRGRIVYVNARLEAMFRYEPDELLGSMIEVLMPERFHQAHMHHRHGYMENPHVRGMGNDMELAGKRKDGGEFALEAGLSSLHLNDDTLVVVTITDISKRKQVEDMLAHQVEERTHEVVRRQQVAEGIRAIIGNLISNHSLLDTLDYIAAEAVRLLRADFCVIYHRDEVVGTLHSQVMRGAIPGELHEQFVRHLPRQRRIYDEPLLVTPDMVSTPAFGFETSDESASNTPLSSSLHSSSWVALTVPVRGTQIFGVLLFGFAEQTQISGHEIDLAVRMADLTVLAFANAHLRAQIEHSAVAAERSRIARDLHDAVTQTLFSASIIAGVLPTIWQRNEEEGRRRLEELRELTRGALAEMRTLLLELRPAKLVEVDLADLLRQLAEAISGRARVPVTLQVEGTSDVSADVKVALYRVAQEALNNIAKHAQAHSAHIKLYRSPEQITLSVRDDGIGFAFEHIAPQHLGLGIMRERADAIGASLSVRSAPGEGTTVEVCWKSSDPTADILVSGK